MKKVFAILLAVSMLLFQAGCGSPAEASSQSAQQPDEWGISLHAEDVTPTGLTLVCTQSGGAAAGELQTGSPFALECVTDGVWLPLPTVPGILDWAWTMEAWAIARDSTVRWTVDWNFLYGALEPGNYRISKEIMSFRGPGDYTEKTYYVEFAIVQ